MVEIKGLIGQVASGATLSREMAYEEFDSMMSGEVTPAQIGALLVGLRVRGETVDEITGAVTAMRAKMLTVAAPDDAIDVVGTGGDASGSFNISTCAAFIVAGAGVPGAQQGHPPPSSRSGGAGAPPPPRGQIYIAPGKNRARHKTAGGGFMFSAAHQPGPK